MSQQERSPLDFKEGYDRWSAIYDADANPLVALETQVVQAWFGDPRGLRVADVGCGTGRHARWLAEHGARVDGFDGSGGMMQQARAKLVGHSVNLRTHELPEPLPAADHTYDLVVFALVADHVAELQTVFSDLRRATKPHGQMIFSVMHPAMNLKGVSARFIDPELGERVYVASRRHTCSDYVMAVLHAGWRITEMTERVADERLVAAAPRADRYLGWPMLLAMRLHNP